MRSSKLDRAQLKAALTIIEDFEAIYGPVEDELVAMIGKNMEAAQYFEVFDDVRKKNKEGKKLNGKDEILERILNLALTDKDLKKTVDSIAELEAEMDHFGSKGDSFKYSNMTKQLIERLKEGRIYLPDNAQRAIEGFFKPANLTALRELALRRTADRVDDQMVDFLRQSAIEGPWATSERLLVLVGPDPLSEKVLRTASRLASGLHAPWLAVSLARPNTVVDAAALQRLDDTLRLAERLGAETRRVIAEDFAAEAFKIARREHITQIVVGGSRRPWPAAHPRGRSSSPGAACRGSVRPRCCPPSLPS